MGEVDQSPVVVVHGPSAACHEAHGALAGRFEDASRRLAEARAGGSRAIVGTWLTRSSCRSLVHLVDWLLGHGVAGWVIVWPRVSASRLESAPRIVPRMGIAVPHALRAVQRARQRGLAVALVGLPSCVLGPFAELRVAGTAGEYGPPCEGCSARDGCSGVDPWYLERFGAEELRAVSPIERRVPPPWLLDRVPELLRTMEGES